mgnify:CR=1 FL=1|jgi:hypothetical protein
MECTIIPELLYKYISFKMVMKLRICSKSFCNIYDDEYFWSIINLTDVSIRDVDSLRDSFENQYITIYNLSNKDRSIMSIPFTILSKLKNTKLLIF